MKNVIQKSMFVALVVTLSLFNVFAVADEFSDKVKLNAIEKYLQVVPVGEMLNDMTAKVAKTLPEANRQSFVEIMTKKFNQKLLEDAMKNSMYKHFTLGELTALTEFYSKPEGRSIMKKMGDYMSDIMPVIQSEMIRISQESRPQK